jgi:hypothetical protein
MLIFSIETILEKVKGKRLGITKLCYYLFQLSFLVLKLVILYLTTKPMQLLWIFNTVNFIFVIIKLAKKLISNYG